MATSCTLDLMFKTHLMKIFRHLFLMLIATTLLVACVNKKEKSLEALQKGKSSFNNNDFRTAIHHLTVSLEYQPGFDQALFYRANAYYNLRINDSAMADFNACIEASPTFADGYANRGRLKFDNGDRDGACKDWLKAKECGSESMTERLQNCN